MCAGATVWTVLTRFGIEAGDRVGIMGVGGLGHIAIKLAAALGYHVVVLSSSESKRQEAAEYGASEYYAFRSGEKPAHMKPLKHLLLCGSGRLDYQQYVTLPRAACPWLTSHQSDPPHGFTQFHLSADCDVRDICDSHAAVMPPRNPNPRLFSRVSPQHSGSLGIRCEEENIPHDPDLSINEIRYRGGDAGAQDRQDAIPRGADSGRMIVRFLDLKFYAR